MFAAVKTKTNEAMVKLSEKILSSVSGILEYNCCKLEALMFILIGKYIRKELTGCSKTRFFFKQSLDIQVKKE